MEEAREGTATGALTFFLSQELRKDRVRHHLPADVFEAVAPRISSRFPDRSTPSSRGPGPQVFGVERIEPMKFVRVIQRTATG